MIVKDLVAAKGWTSIVPLNLNGDNLTDMLSYNAKTGRAIYSVGAQPAGTQVIVKDMVAAKGWTSIVPLKLNGNSLSDMLSYNANTGRAIYSVGAQPAGMQVIVKDLVAAKGWTAIVPMKLNGDSLSDMLSYNANTAGRSIRLPRSHNDVNILAMNILLFQFLVLQTICKTRSNNNGSSGAVFNALQK